MNTLDDTELSSRKRAGASSRRLARERVTALLRDQWWLMAVLCGGVWLAALPLLLTVEGDQHRGFVLGVTASFSLILPAWLVAVFAGLGPTTAGEAAEQWTADALSVMRAQGWRVAHHVRDAGDKEIDHILVGPGGVIVVETKWSAYSWGAGHRSLRSAVGQADSRARALRRTLGVDVLAVVVLWGRARDALDGSSGAVDVTGVKVLTGDSLERWLLGRSRATLDQGAQDRAWQAVADLAARGDDRHGPVTRPLLETPTAVVRSVLVGTLAFGLPALTVRIHLGLWLAVTALVAILGALLRRGGRPLDGLALIAGSVGGAALCLGLATLSL